MRDARLGWRQRVEQTPPLLALARVLRVVHVADEIEALGPREPSFDIAAGLLALGLGRLQERSDLHLACGVEPPSSEPRGEHPLERCALHYFTRAVTQCIFDEVARVLAPGGAFAFVVNSAEHLRRKLQYDYAGAKTIELRTLRLRDGLQCHFFSAAELRRLLRGSFAIGVMREGPFRQYEERKICWTVRARRSGPSQSR